MTKFRTIIYCLIIALFLTGCLKEQARREIEKNQIETYIDSLDIPFKILPSGVYIHVFYNGQGNFYKKGDSISISYSGYNLTKKKYFIKNDTLKFILGNNNIFKGWSEIVANVGEGGNGIAIFPYNTAFAGNQTPLVEQNSTLVYFFQITSNNYLINQNALFWAYAHKYYSSLQIADDSLCYIKYFDGLGNLPQTSNIRIDYTLITIEGDTLESNTDKTIDLNSANLCSGLKEGILNMKQGEMGKILIPPQLSFTSTNPFSLLPYTAIYAETRIKSNDSAVEENSRIEKYLFVNKLRADTILPNGIIAVSLKKPALNATKVTLGATISYTDTIFINLQNTVVQSCSGCQKIVNSGNFESWQIQCLELMKKDETKFFIIPYSQAFGSSGNGSNIPPYTTLIYKVKITNVE